MRIEDLFSKQVNYYDSCTNPQVKGTTNFYNVLFAIRRGGHINGEKVKELRRIADKDNYEKFKKEDIFTWTPGALFNSYRSRKKVIEPTGLIYVDVDYIAETEEEHDSIKKQIIDNEYCVFCASSSSGRKYAAFYYSPDVTVENYPLFYDFITEKLIPPHLINEKGEKTDITCRTIERQNIISFDEKVLIKKEFEPIPFCEVSSSMPTSPIQKSITTPIYNGGERKSIITPIKKEKKREKVSGYDTFLKTRIKTKVELDDYLNQDCVYIPGGRIFYECYTPYDAQGVLKKIPNGKRNTILSAFINNLVLINQEVRDENLLKYIFKVNATACYEPLSDKEISSIFYQKKKMLNEGKLQPIFSKGKNRMKYYWVNPVCEDKFDAYNKCRKLNLVDFFDNEIRSIPGKITYKVIAGYLGKSEVTIKRNITDEQKTIIKEINQSRKEIKASNGFNSEISTISPQVKDDAAEDPETYEIDDEVILGYCIYMGKTSVELGGNDKIKQDIVEMFPTFMLQDKTWMLYEFSKEF